MYYTTLGNTAIEVSKICLGTMTFGEQNTEQEAHEQLDYAFSRGINFIDAAEMYPVPGRKETQGATERYIGTWLQKTSNREKVVLATKVTGPSKGLSYIREDLGIRRRDILQAIEGSLKRLQTDYIDLYQLHWPQRKTNKFGLLGYAHDPEDPWQDNFQEVLETLEGLIKEGKIRHYGVSNETPWGLHRVLHLSEQHNLPRCVSVQNPYSLLNRTYEIGLAEMSIREQCGLLAYSPLGFGVLTGKYRGGKMPKGSRLDRYKVLSRYSGETAFAATEKYARIAEKYGFSLAHLALAFVNSRPFATSNIIGATTLEQLKENIASIDVQLPEEVLQEIDAVHHENSNPAP